jgi:hypothetical protein
MTILESQYARLSKIAWWQLRFSYNIRNVKSGVYACNVRFVGKITLRKHTSVLIVVLSWSPELSQLQP